MQNATATRFKVLGINQDSDFCECCGKTGINSVIWIEDTETGAIKHFGQVCAIKPAKGFDCVNEIKAEIKSAKSRLEMMLALVGRIYRERGGKMELGDEPNSIRPANLVLYQAIKAEQTAKAFKGK